MRSIFGILGLLVALGINEINITVATTPEELERANAEEHDIILVDVEDMTYETAAQVMGVPIGTVRSRLFRGRRLLQEKLLTVAEDLGFVPAGTGGAR